jgi:hypothetical protein
MIFEPMVRSTQTMHLSCVKVSTVSENDQNEHPLEPHHLLVPLGVSKMASKPMVCLAHTMHLSCTDTNTVSKRKEERFHMTHVTLEFHRVHPKWFMSLWYVWHKLCSYLALTLTLNPNKNKWDFTWPTSPMSFIGCVQNDLWAYGTFDANLAPILRQD